MTIKLQWRLEEGHDTVGVFVGPDRGHLALAGYLRLRRDESISFRETVRQGVSGMAGAASGIFESGWPEGLGEEGL